MRKRFLVATFSIAVALTYFGSCIAFSYYTAHPEYLRVETLMEKKRRIVIKNVQRYFKARGRMSECIGDAQQEGVISLEEYEKINTAVKNNDGTGWNVELTPDGE